MVLCHLIVPHCSVGKHIIQYKNKILIIKFLMFLIDFIFFTQILELLHRLTFQII